MAYIIINLYSSGVLVGKERQEMAMCDVHGARKDTIWILGWARTQITFPLSMR